MAVRIGELLLAKGIISEKGLAEAQQLQKTGDPSIGITPGDKLGRIIIRKGLASPMEVVKALCEQRNINDCILVSNYVVSPMLVAKVPAEVAQRLGLVPLVKLEEDGQTALVATNRPQSATATAEVEALLGLRVEWVDVKDRRFGDTIQQVYSLMNERGAMSVRIGEVLVREGLVKQDEVEWALQNARRSNTRLGRVLIEEGLVSEKDFYTALAKHKRLPLVKAVDILSDKESSLIATQLSRTFAIFNEVVPFKHDGEVLSVACSDAEGDLASLHKIYHCKEIGKSLVTLTDMVALLKSFYNLDEEEARRKGIDSAGDQDDEDLISEAVANEGGVELSGADLQKMRQQFEKLFSNLLHEAIRRRASDIHIEVYENFVVVRLRIDGLLYDARTLRIDKSNVGGVVNVIKILSDINIAERRLPQGGRFKKRTAAGEVFDFRVQVQPTLFGENVVIRLLNQTASIVPLTDLHFAKRHLTRYMRAIQNPSGLILMTGPTGSGKTTTLYSTLDLLRKDTTIKIVTVEDPIEYSLPRIQQSQTHDLIGYNFASATRAFLREDPDVALVGEIRDEETARETIKLSQTGHLVFSTLHTNTAAGASGRMCVLGVEPEMLAGELLVVIAQRLAAKICPECKTTYQPADDVLADFYPLGVPKRAVFHKGAGCSKCDGLGHRGRVALAEFWFVDQESRALISRRANEDDIIGGVIGTAFFPLLADALEKVNAGLVDISTLSGVMPLSSIRAAARTVQERNLVPAAPDTPEPVVSAAQ